VGNSYNLEPIALGEFAQSRRIVGERRLKRFLRLPFRVLRCQFVHTIERKRSLCIQRMLGPDRAVLVERGDAVLR